MSALFDQIGGFLCPDAERMLLLQIGAVFEMEFRLRGVSNKRESHNRSGRRDNGGGF
ncbi:hypothetical protein [Candidatus Symbiopectobacterium sp. 'North America']|uniref:hypothetical protein n=1 Tax=Candidatus Symbiopectobacterium sp. 'North America' TaxID=2794574 RepID=UPI001FD2D789|nr:hypothetical protein [Candidatus Symbiopectobacterium sp. 'North America']